MVYDFDGLTQSTADKCESIWMLSGSEADIELEDRPALIRGRGRSDGSTRNERRPRSLSASGRRITSAVAKFVVKSKNGEERPEEGDELVAKGEFVEKESAEVVSKATARILSDRDLNTNKDVEVGNLKQSDKHEAEKGIHSTVKNEEKVEKGGGVGSVVAMLGKVLSPRRLPRTKVKATPEVICCNEESLPESPQRHRQTHRIEAAVKKPPFIDDLGEADPLPDSMISSKKTSPRIVSPLKVLSQRTIGGFLRGSGNNDATDDSPLKTKSICSSLLTASPNKQGPASILRNSSHRPVRRPSNETGSKLNDSNVTKNSVRETRSILGGSEHGIRSSYSKENDDGISTYSKTVSSLVSPRRKMSSRKLNSEEVLQRAKARRQSGTGSSSGTKKKGTSGTRQETSTSESRERPSRRFSEGSGNTAALTLATQQSYDSSLHSERKRSNRESSRGRPRKLLETKSDHISTSSTRRRATSAHPKTKMGAEGRLQRRFSEGSGNTATSRLTTRTCSTTSHSERPKSRASTSRGRPRKTLEARSDHISTTRTQRPSSESRGKQQRRFSEISGTTATDRLTTRKSASTIQSERSQSRCKSSRGRPRKSLETCSDHDSTTRGRSASTLLKHSSESRDKPQRRYSAGPGNTAAPQTYDKSLHQDSKPSDKEFSRDNMLLNDLTEKTGRTNTPSREKSTSEPAKTSPPASKEKRRGCTQIDRTSTSGRSSTPSRTRTSHDDPTMLRQKA